MTNTDGSLALKIVVDNTPKKGLEASLENLNGLKLVKDISTVLPINYKSSAEQNYLTARKILSVKGNHYSCPGYN